jgi:hypothetical protein
MTRHKKQTRLSLAPLEDSTGISTDNLAVNDQSQLASVRFGNTPSHPKNRFRERRSRPDTFESPPRQGTLDMAFARAASRKGSGNGPSAGEMEPEEMNG